jgi:PAS domain S-box-containing protein
MQSPWFFPKPTGDVGRDRNARTLQFSCLLFASALGAIAVLDLMAKEQVPLPILLAAVSLFVAAAINRSGRSVWAGRTAVLVLMACAILLVFEAHDGFRSHAMLVFPGLLLISIMLLDRASYLTTAGLVLLAVAALGVAEKHGLTRARAGMRSPTTYDSIFYVELTLAVFAMIGSRIANDDQRNVLDLHATIDQLSRANLELSESTAGLRESQQELVSIYDAVRDIIFHLTVEPEGRYRFASVNAAFLSVTGLSREMVVGKTVNEVIPEPSLTMALGKYRRAIEEKTTVFWEETSDYPTGRLTGEVSVVPVFDGQGACTDLIGSVHDITERKRAEAALRNSDERLALAQNAARLGVWDSDLNANVITISGQYAQLLGLSPDCTTIPREELLGLIHPEDRERVNSLRREARERTHIFDAEFRVVWPEGSIHWLHAKGTVLVGDSGLPRRSMGAIWDITERKLAEARLRESEERFRRVFEEGPLGLGLVGRDYRFLKVNSALCQMLDFSEDELLLKSFVDITHPDDVRADIELAEELFRREIPFYRMQKRYLKKGGEFIWINLTASVIRDHDGEPLYGLAMVEDITEVRRAQEQAFARQKLESVGTLAGGIAHDFNNLLGGVLAQAELGLGELAAGSNPVAELKAVRDAAVRGSEIVRELMVYAGKETAVVGLVDVSQIVGEMLELLKVSVSKHALLEANLGKDLPPVRANAAQLRQIVMNLVTNASEAIGGQDGVIQVSTKCVRRSSDSEPIPDPLAEGDYVQMEVSDTGCGMMPETQAKVFDPFFTTKSAGHGLGLAVVQGIVRDLGGSIDLVSALGKGTTFQILLPVAETADPATSDPVSGIEEPMRPSQPRTVLLVEDELPLRRAVGKMLRRRGFEVFEAGDGFSAISLLRANAGEIDLILLDLTIPGASSREVVADAAQVRPDIRVILTSAYGQEMIKDMIGAPQVRNFIRKPFQLADLVKTLENALSEGEEKVDSANCAT